MSGVSFRVDYLVDYLVEYQQVGYQGLRTRGRAGTGGHPRCGSAGRLKGVCELAIRILEPFTVNYGCTWDFF